MFAGSLRAVVVVALGAGLIFGINARNVDEAAVAALDSLAVLPNEGLALLESGEPLAGARALLMQVRALGDSPEAFDDAEGAIQLLVFTMCALLPQDELITFYSDELDPAVHPMDQVVLLEFIRLFSEYEVGRQLRFTSQDDLRQQLLKLTTDAPLAVRLGALGLLADPEWDLDRPASWQDVMQVEDAVVRLAREYPHLRLAQDTLRYVLLCCCWSNQLRSELADLTCSAGEEGFHRLLVELLNDDPMKEAVLDQQSEGFSLKRPQDAQNTLRDLLFTSASANVRYWALRALRGQVTKAELRAIVQDEAGDAQTLDRTHAQMLLLAMATDAKAWPEAEEHANELLAAVHVRSVPDTNVYGAVANAVGAMGMARVKAGDYEGAARVFAAIAAQYPQTELAALYGAHEAHALRIQQIIASSTAATP